MSEQLTLSVRTTTKCGGMGQEHEVIITLTAWGMIEFFSPCQFLPDTARKLAGIDCLERLSPLVEELAQDFYCDYQPIPPLSRKFYASFPKAREFVEHWRENLTEGAMTKLKEMGLTTTNDEDLKAFLDSPDPNLRCSATIIAGAMEKRALIPELVRLVEKEENFCVQLSALLALTKMPDPYTAPTLAKWLDTPNLRESIRAEVVRTLGEIKEPCAVEPLIRSLKSGNQHLRKVIIWALGEIRDPRAVTPLISIWGESSQEIREGIIEALGKIGDAHSVEFLRKILLSKDFQLRSLAAWALAETKTSYAVSALVEALGDGDEKVREIVTKALVEIGQPAVEPLIAALKVKGEWVRRQIVKILIQLGSSAVEPLRNVLKERGVEPRVHVLAQQALRRILQMQGIPKRLSRNPQDT